MLELKSLVILKPDALHRNLFDLFVKQLKANGLEIDEYRYIKSPDATKINEHYEEYVNEDWYSKLFIYMHSGPIIVMAVKPILKNYLASSGDIIDFNDETSVNYIRKFALTFRQMHKINFTYNTIHSSDSIESAERELKIWGLYP
jgi:nucleoside-diphosphate kinase